MIFREKRERKVGMGMVAVIILFFVMGMIASVSVKAAGKLIVDTDHQKYTYGELRTDLKELQSNFGEYCQVRVVGKSVDNRNLYEVILGNPQAKKHLIVIANLHAREYMTTQLCMKQIEYYLNNYDNKSNGEKISSILNEVAIHIVPSANPDGTAISQFGFGAISNKSLRRQLNKMPGNAVTWKANARGVDLNRNWDIAFKKSGTRGSFGFHGNKAASEPEVKALVSMVNRIEKEGKVVGVISYHSTGSILYGRCAAQATNTVEKITTKLYQLVRKHTGYRLMPTESISYANGCSREYFLYKRNLPCVTIEVGRGTCPLSQREFSSIWRKNKDIVINAAQLF